MLESEFIKYSVLLHENHEMILLPFEHITLVTQLKPEEVTRRLQVHTQPVEAFRTMFSKTRGRKAYEGKINGSSFKISRVIYYRNSFLPVIYGNISSKNGQTMIDVKMKLHPFVMVFLLVFLIFWLGITIQDGDTTGTWITIALVTIVLAVFKYESSRSKKWLIELLEVK